MHASIAVMNTKGGVGKSTLVLALAETLSANHGKTVLVIDSDAQASVSSMLMTINSLHRLQTDGLTIVDFLVATVLNGESAAWSKFVVGNVSDVDDARSVYVLPSDMQLTLFEREVSKESLHGRLRTVISQLLAEVTSIFDIVLIDCPPGLSVLTECWLREADYHISPTKADYVSVCGLEVFRRFKSLNPEMGFAENLGVIVNMKDHSSTSDNEYHRWLADNPENRCFTDAVPRMGSLQDAARFRSPDRSFMAKYPGQIGVAVKALAAEVLVRLAAGKPREMRGKRAAQPTVLPSSGPAAALAVADSMPSTTTIAGHETIAATADAADLVPADLVPADVVPANVAEPVPASVPGTFAPQVVVSKAAAQVEP